MTFSSAVNLAVIGPASTELLGADIELPATVALHRHSGMAPPYPHSSDDANSGAASAVLWWCVVDGGSVTPELWNTCRAWRSSGAIVMIFILGGPAAIAAPSDAPLWFQLEPGQESLALCPVSMIWSSLGNSSHIALDWNDLRAVTDPPGQGLLQEIIACTQEELVSKVEAIHPLRQWLGCYLHFEGAALQGRTLRQVSRLFSEKMQEGASQIISYEPGRASQRFLARALLR